MRSVALILGCGFLLSCDATGPLPMCDAGAEVVVGPGTQPVISWTPKCAVRWVWVETLPETYEGIVPVVWQRIRWEGTFGSPVQVKFDSTFFDGPREIVLEEGQAYQACLIRFETNVAARLSCTAFTP